MFLLGLVAVTGSALPAAQASDSTLPTEQPMEGMTMDAPVGPLQADADAIAGPHVDIQSFAFVPASLTIPAGTTVTWVNRDAVTHTVTASDRSFSSTSLAPGGQFSFQFTTPGTYTYFCAIHPFMTASVTVE
jgi:plastocyanin